MPSSRWTAPVAALASVAGGAVLALDVTAAWVGHAGVARVVPPLALATAALALATAALAGRGSGRAGLLAAIGAAALLLSSAGLRPDGAILAGGALAGALALDVAANVCAGVIAVRAAGAVEDEGAPWAVPR